MNTELDNIKQVERWQTSDGKEHYTLSSAQYHAGEMDKAAQANAILEAGGSVADALRGSGWTHAIEPILERVTKHTRLVISHWQCRDTPGYKVIHFRSDRKLHVWGNAGCWSGPYGGSVTLQDLARYASNSATDFALPPIQPDSRPLG